MIRFMCGRRGIRFFNLNLAYCFSNNIESFSDFFDVTYFEVF